MTEESVRAVRATVQIGSLTVDGFMLPDGGYRMSQTQAAECVDLSERNAREFLQSKALKSLLGEGYTPATSEIEPDAGQLRGGSRIRAWSLEVASAYWLWQAARGNKKALSLVMALLTETLERRFDSAFGITRTEEERNELLSQRVQQLQRDLEILGNAYAAEDEIRSERDYYERLLRENGIDPWRVPGGGDESG
ncbi:MULTISPECIES: hypothetical protein [Kamptonema]|uniref:hypothetical protein n=1 Tax=Kamptonema TaxID=1501433 RepID=UPI0001DAC13C|nr:MULTISPECIES: hypothetical protein [Kamptonema]CBN56626.1 hypothetical protein OSCI_3090019 [Kamptonema sp. PCC 6506]